MGHQIVQCANFVAPRSGGLRTTLRHLAAGYASAGHRVVQIVPGHRDTRTETPWGAVVTLRAPVVPGTGYRVIVEPWRVTDALDRIGPDRLEVHDRLTLRRLGGWARRRGVPSLVVSHERLDRLVAGRLPGGAGLRRVVDATNRGLAGGFDTVVCTTGWAAEEFRRLPVRNLVQIPLGVDLDGFGPQRRDAVRRHAPPDVPLLVSAVRLSPEKAPDRLVDTVRELVRRGRPVHLVIAGDGPLRPRLERAAAGLPVTFAGFLADRAELAGLLAAADVALAPGPVETFGLAALEALACGTPVVVDAGSALPEVVGPAGRAVPGEAVAFADAVEDLLAAPRSSTRTAARARAERFTWPATVAAFLRVHRLSSARGPTAGAPVADPAGAR